MATIPSRDQVKQEDSWDLGSLYNNDSEWEKDFQRFSEQISSYSRFQGMLAVDKKNLLECLRFHFSLEELGERLSYYAFLRYAEDASNSENQAKQARIMQLAAKAEAEASF
jgi:oligoendopeptidase F